MYQILKAILYLFVLGQSLQAGRYYSSEEGRFISRDPLGFVDGYGLYNAYFAEHLGMDPSGLWEIKRNGEARAIAVAESGDTIRDLAKKNWFRFK